MTIQDLHNNFDIELDKTLDFEYPYILPEQKDYWLNKAQDRFVDQIVYPKDPNKKGFEEIQKNIDNIRTLVKPSGDIVPVDSKTSLPTDYLYLVRHTCTTVSTCGTKTVGGIFAKQEHLNQMLKDPFWTPSPIEPLYTFIGNQIVYETLDRFTISKTNLTYIKQPVKMRLGTAYQIPTTNLHCELPEHTHQDILDIAISMVLENIESQRYQTNLNELNN